MLHVCTKKIFIANIQIRFTSKNKRMDYKKKALNNLDHSQSYEEIDTRLASGWYVDSPGSNKKKKYKTKKVAFKISKKTD